MADPNQTPIRGDWKCPCNGCKKAAKKQKEYIINFLMTSGYTEIAFILQKLEI